MVLICASASVFAARTTFSFLCRRASSSSRRCSRPRSSAAAASLKVTATRSSTRRPSTIRFSSRRVSTKVLPLPAPASMATLPRYSVMKICSSVSRGAVMRRLPR